MNRTVEPGLIVSAAGSNAALVVPFPVIFTSTTTASVAGAAGAAAAFAVPGTAAAAWDVLDLLPPPQAPATRARSVVSAVNRIADSSGTMALVSLVNAFTITAPLAKRETSQAQAAVALSHADDDTPPHAQPGALSDLSARARAAPRPWRAAAAARHPRQRARRARCRELGADPRLPCLPRLADVRAPAARLAGARSSPADRRDVRTRELEQAGDAVPARAGLRCVLRHWRDGRLGDGLSAAVPHSHAEGATGRAARPRGQGRPVVRLGERRRRHRRRPGASPRALRRAAAGARRHTRRRGRYAHARGLLERC